MKSKNKIAVGISGGVDSATCLYLLQQNGYEVFPVFIKMCRYKGDLSHDIESAEKVAEALGLNLKILDASKDFSEKVVGYYDKEISRGNTPSPCVVCNPQVKFRKLMEYADEIGATYIATGHYARVEQGEDGIYHLLIGKDKQKDQTYALSFLDQEILSKLVLPLGEYRKDQIYKIASKIKGFEDLQSRSQSQDFCFLQQSEIGSYLRHRFKKNRGDIVDINGNKIGEHQGLFFYTIGQRKGIGLHGGPYYVVAKDKEKNQLKVSKEESDLMKKIVVLRPFNLIEEKLAEKNVMAKLRDSTETNKAIATIKGDSLVLDFERAQRAVTPGQVGVIYYKNRCLGSGFITNE